MKLLRRLIYTLIIIFIIALTLRFIFFKGPVLPPQALPTSPIIDMHVHIAGLGYGSDSFVSDEMKKGYKFDYYLNAFGITREQIEQHGDQLVVKKVAQLIEQSQQIGGAVILAMDGVIDKNGLLDKTKTQVYIPNDFVAQQTAKYPSLYFGASINPYRPDALALLEQAKQQGAVLIKWIPNIQHIDPADEKIIPFYKKLKELNLPLLSHTGQERSFGSAIDEYGDPQRLRLPLSLGVTVIAGHIATTGETDQQSNYQRILEMFDEYPNLYADISSLTQINKLGYLNTALVEDKLKGRLIYGSDFPLNNMVLVSPYYFPLNLTLNQMWQITKIKNPFDRDIALKQALGMPANIFDQSRSLLAIEYK
ncbi:MAG: amidohydrolase family protein [Methylophaga sp.]|nr:amidohydrolase family protein [Methylophaga sp.]